MSRHCHTSANFGSKPNNQSRRIYVNDTYINETVVTLTIRVPFQQEKLIADYEAMIAAKEKDIESIQEEIAKQAENSDVNARGHSTVRSELRY